MSDNPSTVPGSAPATPVPTTLPALAGASAASDRDVPSVVVEYLARREAAVKARVAAIEAEAAAKARTVGAKAKAAALAHGPYFIGGLILGMFLRGAL